MRRECHVVTMRTETPSLCLDCGRAACKGCVTLGVDREGSFSFDASCGSGGFQSPPGERKRLITKFAIIISTRLIKRTFHLGGYSDVMSISMGTLCLKRL